MNWVKKHRFESIVITLFVALIVVAVIVLREALVRLTEDKNAVPALAAAIALTGALFAAGVALTGHLLKQSIDLRTARLAEDAAERAVLDQKRLHMQAALDTVRALGTPDGRPAHAAQASAALLVLARLDELYLALELAAELWPPEQITSSSAVQLVEAGLKSGDYETQHAAAMLLRNNTSLLYVSQTQYEWPRSLDSWRTDLPLDVRRILAVTLKEWIHVRPATANDWRAKLVEDAVAREVDATVRDVLRSAT